MSPTEEERNTMPITTNAAELRIEFAPLFCQYRQSGGPQGAYVEIDPRPSTQYDIYASYNSEIGNAIPMDEYHGIIMRPAITPLVRGSEIADLLESESVQALAARIIAGHSQEWDGSNVKGRLDPDAGKAYQELEALLNEQPPTLDYAASADWIQYARVEVTSTDENLESQAAEIDTEANDGGTILVGDVLEALTERRQLYRDQGGW